MDDANKPKTVKPPVVLGTVAFADRNHITELAITWCKEQHLPLTPENMIHAANAVGALKHPPVG